MMATTTETTATTESIGREEAMDLAVDAVMQSMTATELACIYMDMSDDGEDEDEDEDEDERLDFILGDMSHNDLAVVYVENCDDESLEELTGCTIDSSLDDNDS